MILHRQNSNWYFKVPTDCGMENRQQQTMEDSKNGLDEREGSSEGCKTSSDPGYSSREESACWGEGEVTPSCHFRRGVAIF